MDESDAELAAETVRLTPAMDAGGGGGGDGGGGGNGSADSAMSALAAALAAAASAAVSYNGSEGTACSLDLRREAGLRFCAQGLVGRVGCGNNNNNNNNIDAGHPSWREVQEAGRKGPESPPLPPPFFSRARAPQGGSSVSMGSPLASLGQR